jgi:hypothetical protein
MTFAFRPFTVAAAALLLAPQLAFAPAFATPAKLDTDTCNQLRLEHMKYVASGAEADLQRGPDWAKANLSQEKLRDLELYIQLDEQVKFGCRDAKLTLDAERAGEAAKRLELNPDLDPTAPAPAPPAASQSAGDSSGGAEAPSGLSAPPPVSVKPKPEPKTVPRPKPDAFVPGAAIPGNTGQTGSGEPQR